MSLDKEYYINRFAEDSLKPEEQEELQKLIRKGNVQEDELEDLRQIIIASKKSYVPEFTVNKDFNPSLKAYTTKAFNRYTLLKIAAVLVIGIGLGVIGMNYLNRSNNHFIHAETKQGDRIHLTLPGDNHIHLNGQSAVKYRASFTGSDRVIDLKGEAYFQFAEIQNTPVIIACNDVEIICYQGSFNIENDIDSEKTEIEVEKGCIIISHSALPEKQYVVEAGSKGIIDKHIPIWIEENQNQNYLAWHTGKMEFKYTTLEDVAETLTEVYDIPVEVKGESRNCFFNKNFNQASLDEVLRIIESTLQTTILKKKNKVIITGKPC